MAMIYNRRIDNVVEETGWWSYFHYRLVQV